jgi:hypothetical protein
MSKCLYTLDDTRYILFPYIILGCYRMCFMQIALGLSLVPAPYLPQFLVHFEWLDDECELGFHKTSLYPRGKNATIKDLKLKVLICFKSPITKHWTPLHQTSHILSILLSNWEIFVVLEALGGTWKGTTISKIYHIYQSLRLTNWKQSFQITRISLPSC